MGTASRKRSVRWLMQQGTTDKLSTHCRLASQVSLTKSHEIFGVP